MNELIKLQPQTINGNAVETVNARELHAFLQNRDHFATWIRDRIAQYDFVENQDYVRFTENSVKPQGGRPTKEYFLTLDMAKELAMVENNESGLPASQICEAGP